MRKLLIPLAALVIAGPAFAADMPVKAPPIATPAPGWTGCYGGITVGGVRGESQWTSISTSIPVLFGLPVADHDMSRATVGGTVGCNYQMNAVVLGAEGDLSWINLRDVGSPFSPFGGTVETRQDWVGTLRARLGYSFSERWLVYVTGGLAVTRAELRVFGNNPTFDVSEWKSRTGWTVGAGTEAAIDAHWSAKFEYLHMDFGNANYFDPDVPVLFFAILAERNKLTDDVIRVGLNYAFR